MGTTSFFKFDRIIATLLLSSILPYWIARTLQAERIKLSFFSVSSLSRGGSSKLRNELLQIFPNAEQMESLMATTKTSSLGSVSNSEHSSSAQRNGTGFVFPCCTASELLLTLWWPAVVPSVPSWKEVSLELAHELGLDLNPELVLCNSSLSFQRIIEENHGHDQNSVLFRCVGPLRERGYFSTSISTSISGDFSPILVDFIVPSKSSFSIQEMVDRVAMFFSSSSSSQPQLVWHQFERGFRYLPDKNSDPITFSLDNPWVVDMSNLWSKENKIFKRHVAHIETTFQVIDIYDSVDTQVDRVFLDHQQDGDDDAKLAAKLVVPDREVYFDSIMQSRKRGLEAYHEALVQPLMLSHKNPRRVAIFGGGEGATLREVLKHNTVEECVMIEIDEEIVQASREVLRDWNDCSGITLPRNKTHNNIGQQSNEGYESCYDDPRATLFYEDAIAWFIQRFFGKENVTENEKFDVIILDSLDPGSMLEFSDIMYGNLDFAHALRSALREGGILGGQVGIEKEYDLDDDHDLSRMVENLYRAGFVAVRDYMEGSCGFDDPWKFFVAPTDMSGLARWYTTSAQIDVELSRRSVITRSEQFPFWYVDGATVSSYQAPSRVAENLFCENIAKQKESCGRQISERATEDDGRIRISEPSTARLIETMKNFHSPLDRYAEMYGLWYYGEEATMVAESMLTTKQLDRQREFYNPSWNRRRWMSLAANPILPSGIKPIVGNGE